MDPVLSEIQIWSDGTTSGAGAFTLTATVTDKEGGEHQFLIPGITVNFTTTNGTCTPSAVAGEDEEFAHFVFQTDDILNFEGATVTGTCEYKGKTYEGTCKVLPLDWDYILTCKNSGQTIDKEGKATLQFQLMASTTANLAGTATTDIIVMSVPRATVSFAASEGSCSPVSGVTDEAGMVEVIFQASDPKTFEEGTVTATYVKGAKITTGEGEVKGDPEAFVDPCDTGDADLNKANLLDNAYVVRNTKTGETMTRSYNPDYSEWTKTPDVIKFQLNDEEVDAQGNPDTKGMLYGFIPLTMRGVVLALTGQQFENTPGAKVGFGVYDGLYVSTDFMCTSGEGGTMTTEGEIKPDGRSKIMLRKPCNQNHVNAPRRTQGDEQEDDYTGEYELLYYLVFTTQAWNPETQQTEEVDLEVYGKGTMVMHVPSVTSFVLNADKDWVKVGESTKVTLEQYYEEGATWDWNDVQIIGQSSDYSEARNGTDNGFFSWDSATQTLTSLKSNDNKRVWVYLGLKSKPSVKAPVTVATGEGWKYTTIGTSVEEITTHANSYPPFSMTWAPKDSDNESFDFSAVELDPESVPVGYFSFPTSYASQGWPLFVSSSCPPGEYNLKIRVKSNHDVYCTLKVIITPEEE